MPLRDHFHPPLDHMMPWDGFHGMWPAMIVLGLSPRLPERFVAAPQVHLGSSLEIDAATHEVVGAVLPPREDEVEGGVATAVWAPPRATLSVMTDPPDPDEYEVRVYDAQRGRRLVAAVEIVSPANKDRPEHRRAFVAKCASLLQSGVCVVIVDVVTTRAANLYADLLDHIGQADPSLVDGSPPLYAVSCRWAKKRKAGLLEVWAHSLELGKPLPTLPLWLAEDLAVPLELESSYEKSRKGLRIP